MWAYVGREALDPITFDAGRRIDNDGEVGGRPRWCARNDDRAGRRGRGDRGTGRFAVPHLVDAYPSNLTPVLPTVRGDRSAGTRLGRPDRDRRAVPRHRHGAIPRENEPLPGGAGLRCRVSDLAARLPLGHSRVAVALWWRRNDETVPALAVHMLGRDSRPCGGATATGNRDRDTRQED